MGRHRRCNHNNISRIIKEDMLEIKNAQYIKEKENGANGAIRATINGVLSIIPLANGNKDYIEILKQVEAGTLTIADAD